MLKWLIRITAYIKGQQDALFFNFILVKKNSTCFGQTTVHHQDTVFTAICICHASYVDCVLARSGSR